MRQQSNILENLLYLISFLNNMSFQAAYNKSASRDIEFEPKTDLISEEEKQEEIKKWLSLPITKQFLLFLGKRELELLNIARNCAKVKLGNENTDKNLLKAVAYREIIDYLVSD